MATFFISMPSQSLCKTEVFFDGFFVPIKIGVSKTDQRILKNRKHREVRTLGHFGGVKLPPKIEISEFRRLTRLCSGKLREICQDHSRGDVTPYF